MMNNAEIGKEPLRFCGAAYKKITIVIKIKEMDKNEHCNCRRS